MSMRFTSLLAVLLFGCSGQVITDGTGATPNPPPPAAGDPDADVTDPGPGPGPGETPDADVTDPGPDPSDPPDAAPEPDPELQWREANLTNFTSWPEPGSDECENYNGCMWAGRFAFVNGQQTEEWVMMHNIVAVHQRDANTYKLKKLRLRQDGHQIDVTVYDMCADSDCSGCCTRNASETGFLIDVEKYTMERFGSGEGIVEWACLDCN